MGFKGPDFEDNVFGVGSENVKHAQPPIHERDNGPQSQQTRRNNANHAEPSSRPQPAQPQLMMLNGMSLLLMVMTLKVYKVQMMKGKRYSLNILRRPS